MKKQLIVRLIPGAPGVFDVVSGVLKDGSFSPIPYAEIPDLFLFDVVETDLLGTQGYVRSKNLSSLLLTVLDAGGKVEFYPNFLVLNIPEDEPKEKKDEK